MHLDTQKQFYYLDRCTLHGQYTLHVYTICTHMYTCAYAGAGHNNYKSYDSVVWMDSATVYTHANEILRKRLYFITK